jgi:lipopolysaccharide export system protein LptA
MANDHPVVGRATGGSAAPIIGGRRRLWLRQKASLALLAALLLPPRSGGCAAGAVPPTDNRPIAISADSGIEWQKEAQVYVARGNAVATRGTTQVHADTLTAHYRPAKGAEGGNEVYRLDADGHVAISNGVDTVTGDQAIYDVAQQVAVVTGRGLRLTTPSDVVTARDSFEWYDQQQIAVARGDAVAVRGDRRIRADVLTAHMVKANSADAAKAGAPPPAAKSAPVAGNPPGTPANPSGPPPAEAEDARIRRIDAQGNVVVSTPTDIARGDYGVYDAATKIVTLLDNVTITRGQNVIHGPFAVVDLNTNVSRMMALAAAPGKPASRVEGLFVRQDATSQPAGAGTSQKNAPAGAKRP